METRILPCRLTETELLERASRMSELVRELETAEEAKKEAASAAKAQIDSLDGQLGSVAREVREKQAYARNCRELIRLDTGEVIETRALEPHERQVELLSVSGEDAAEVVRKVKARAGQ